MASPGVTVKKRHGGGGAFALGCGCKDAMRVSVPVPMSVSVSASPSATETSTTTATRRGAARTNLSVSTITDTLTLPSASSSFLWEDAEAEVDVSDGDCKLASSASTPSFSGLLRQLNELEQSVVSWGRKSPHGADFLPPAPPPPRSLPLPPHEHNKAKSSNNGNDKEKERGGGGRLEDSVAVVKVSEDPLGDFRQSMLQMIVENGIVTGEELRGLLRRFLALNAPHHHDVILRAFAETWDDVFAGPAATAVAVAPASCPYQARPPPPRPPQYLRRSPPAWRV